MGRNREGTQQQRYRTRSNNSDDSGLVGRRSYLMMAGAAAAAVLGPSGTASADSDDEHPGFEFGTTLDAVDDLGLDPSGDDGIAGGVEDALDDGVVIEFPDGEYRVEGSIRSDDSHAGVRGAGDVTFVMDSGVDELLRADGENFLFEGIDVDQSSDGSCARLRMNGCTNSVIRDVHVFGTGDAQTHSHYLQPGDPEEDGVSIVENYRNTAGSILGTYRDGEGGCSIRRDHVGTVYLRNCHFQEMSNNAVYASRTPGAVRVEGGTFVNNAISGVRISNEGSYVEGATFVIDYDRLENNDSGPGNSTRAIRFESGSDFDFDGAAARNCDVFVLNGQTKAAVDSHRSGGAHTIENCRFQIEEDGTPAILAEESEDPPHDDIEMTIRGCHFTGEGDGATAIDINGDGRDGSVVEDCCIQLPNGDGVDVDDASVSVRNTNINVGGAEIDDGGSVSTEGITTDEACQMPSTDDEPGGGGDEDTEDDREEGDDRDVLQFDGETDAWGDYAVEVGDEIKPDDDASEYGQDYEVVDDGLVVGEVRGGVDGFRVTGGIEALEVWGDDEPTVLLNGTEIDPDEYPDTGVADENGAAGGGDDGDTTEDTEESDSFLTSGQDDGPSGAGGDDRPRGPYLRTDRVESRENQC
ncbi:hypothetical protein [Natronorarus salvus]|uniref:hypothetical protein n=1 Tax=Natronorarus salvus TaxID=3117733 RepID=UPI002F269BC7